MDASAMIVRAGMLAMLGAFGFVLLSKPEPDTERSNVDFSETELVSSASFATADAERQTICPGLAPKPSAELSIVAAPALGPIEIEVWNDDGLQLRTGLAEERFALLNVPAGSLRIVARCPRKSIRDQELELAPGTQRLVGIGFED